MSTSSLFLKGQTRDNIYEILDTLEKSSSYNALELDNTVNNKFSPNEIPKYTDEEYVERIEQLNKYSPFKFTYNKTVRNYINRYLKSPKTVSFILHKTQYYFPLFETYLNQFGLPLELKNLAIVESALNPIAKSHCGAAGLWQFMYGTGKSYHLNVSSVIDDRFDPEKETIAACMYLKDLYKTYKDWPLVLAAYNCGPGNVNKAIRRAGGSREFWDIYDYLPKETQGYVPAFISVCYVTTYYKEHNIRPAINTFNWDKLDFVFVNQKTTLKALSRELQIDYVKLKQLNPQYFADLIPGDNNKIIIPISNGNDISKSKYQLNYQEPVKVEVKESNNTIETNIPLQQDKVSVQTPINEQEIAKVKTRFGTIYNSDVNYIFSLAECKNYSAMLNKQLTIESENTDSLLLKPNTEFIMYNKNAFYANGTYIKEKSQLITKCKFYDNSIVLEVSLIKAFNKVVKINLIAEIIDKPNKIKGYLLEPNYVVLFKS